MYIINRIPGMAAKEKGYAAYPEDFPHLNNGEDFEMWRSGKNIEVESTLTGEALRQRMEVENIRLKSEFQD